MCIYRSEICNLAGTQMQYTDTLIAVMKSATEYFRRRAARLSGRRMEHRLMMICSRNWTCRAHVVRMVK